MDNIRYEKKILRQMIKERKNNLTEDFINDNSVIITKELMNMAAFKKASTIMCYVSFGNEVNTRLLIEECLRRGKRVLVPLVTTDADGTTYMDASELIDPVADLAPGTMGILEPKKSSIRIKDPKIIDFIVIPGLAFDRNGNRLGYGAGYYDYFLARLSNNCHKVAITFSCQIVEQIPRENHDLPIKNILTEKGLNHF